MWIQAFLTDPHSECHFSAASPWEIAIKSRLGKLRLKPRLDATLPDFLVSLGITILSINERQAPTAIDRRKHTIRLTGRL